MFGDMVGVLLVVGLVLCFVLCWCSAVALLALFGVCGCALLGILFVLSLGCLFRALLVCRCCSDWSFVLFSFVLCLVLCRW